ncbi:unnamed protein product, partial [Closterium sp. NIES-54]
VFSGAAEQVQRHSGTGFQRRSGTGPAAQRNRLSAAQRNRSSGAAEQVFSGAAEQVQRRSGTGSAAQRNRFSGAADQVQRRSGTGSTAQQNRFSGAAEQVQRHSRTGPAAQQNRSAAQQNRSVAQQRSRTGGIGEAVYQGIRCAPREMATSTSTLVGNLIILNLAPNGTSNNFGEWCSGVEKHLLSSELKGIFLKDILLNRGKGKMPLPPDPLGKGATTTVKLAFDAKTTKYEMDFSLWEQADAAVIRVFITTTPPQLS